MSTHTIITKTIASMGLAAVLLGGAASTAGADESAALRWEKVPVPADDDSAVTKRIWDYIRP